MCAIIREIREIRVRLNCVCFMVLDYLSTILQSYEKFPNYANYFAIIFANNCKKRKRYNQWLHPCLLFIKQAIHSSELYGTEAAHLQILMEQNCSFLCFLTILCSKHAVSYDATEKFFHRVAVFFLPRCRKKSVAENGRGWMWWSSFLRGLKINPKSPCKSYRYI